MTRKIFRPVTVLFTVIAAASLLAGCADLSQSASTSHVEPTPGNSDS